MSSDESPWLVVKGTKFEVDPEYLGDVGYVYTKSHIPPEAVVEIKNISGV